MRTVRQRQVVDVPPRGGDERIGPAYVFSAGEDTIAIYTDGAVTRLRAGGDRVAEFNLGIEVGRRVMAAAFDGGVLAIALTDRVELWDLATGNRVDSLPVSGRVGDLRVTGGGATVEIRYAVGAGHPKDLPADNGVHHPDPLGPTTLRWERDGVFNTGEAIPGRTSDGGYLLHVDPVPALVPADTAIARAATAVPPRSDTSNRRAERVHQCLS